MSKIKTKVTRKQNLEHFKIIKDCVFTSFIAIRKCCCHPAGQYLLEHLCFCLHQGPTFLHLSTCVFVSINFSVYSYLVHKSENRKTIILS